MTEQQMANYTLTICADSGYESTTEGRCTAAQYGQAMAALHGTFPAPSPAREWVGLTEDEVREVAEHYGMEWLVFQPFYRAIEARLKERNA